MTIVRKAEDDYMEEAKEIFLQGGLVAFPTETVYGLGADAMNAAACGKIYEAKGRPSDNPLIVHIAERDQLDLLTASVSPLAERLMEVFWPGPLTIIFRKRPEVPDAVTGGRDTVAVRMPSHPEARKLLAGCGVPVAAPSANLSGRPSPTCAVHVLDDLQGRVDMIIDGGPVDIGIESTIVDVTSGELKILRPGHITKDMLEAVVGTAEHKNTWKEEEGPPAPGMKYRHYAPKGTLILLSGPLERRIAYIQKQMQSGLHVPVAILTTDEYVEYLQDIFPGVSVLSYGSGAVDEAAKRLYRLLRECDDLDIKVIYSKVFERSGKGYAVMNRLEKAAACRIVEV
ncbi:MAG: L-threonylcarbamoyladenylate synthase [Eubacteriales bacterium]|nr:L-threonylcarbamoyladenylate synthase [Eubacteriales bacterium]